MGEILFRSRISENLFKGYLPGWIVSPALNSCEYFCQRVICGSERFFCCTTATVGKITLAEFKKRHYHQKLSIGP
jgi:hypothetical protein